MKILICNWMKQCLYIIDRKNIFKIELSQIDGTAKDVIRKFMNSQKTFEAVRDEKEKEFLSRFSFICMLSFDVYVKKQIIERLIDAKNEQKDEK